MKISLRTVKASARTVRRKPLAGGTRILVLGNGMVGQKFCEHLVSENLTSNRNVTVLGKEAEPAYDRIHLGSIVEHRDPSRLTIRQAEWYRANGIELRTGIAATSIERETKTVHTATAGSFTYDLLVIATGSEAFVPLPFDEAGLPGVHVYRNLRDIQNIIAEARGKSSAIVIGCGLLGLESAQAMRDLGMKVTVMERSAFLMPQQLNSSASARLCEIVRSKGISIEYQKATSAVSRKDGILHLEFKDGSTASAEMVILATGITPDTGFARSAGLLTGVRGGIVVDGFLATSDPDIFAIGECALLHGRIYGLAAPGFTMAGQLAAMLAGKKVVSLPPPDLSCRLKMAGADMISIGSPLEKGEITEHIQGESYRMICVDGGRVLQGALGIGRWPESGEIQNLYLEGIRLGKKQIAAFAETGNILPPGAPLGGIFAWPDSRIVCNCMSLRKSAIMECMAKCGPDPALIVKGTGASTVCGSCLPLIQQLCDPSAAPAPPVAFRPLIALSAIALIATLLTIFLPPPAMATSLESWWYKFDEIWRDTLIKQITGYTLLGLCLMGLLLSLRKRFKWFRFGHFAKWRVFHSAFGVTALIVLFAHTGFRFGENLNFWLMSTFVGLNLLGAIAGIVSALESRGGTSLALSARRLRPALAYAHFVLFWPLPALLVFHILSVYLY